MTDNLIQKIEERVLGLIKEMDVMRNEIIKLRSENAILRDDHATHVQKLQELVSLLEVLKQSDNQVAFEVGSELEAVVA